MGLPTIRRYSIALGVIFFARVVAAGPPIQTWEREIPGIPGFVDPLQPASRILADGTRLVADRQGKFAVHLDARGVVLSKVSFPTPGAFPTKVSVGDVSIDAFGACFLVGGFGSAFRVSKLDGASGRALWSAPALVEGGGRSVYVALASSFVDGRGDLLVVGTVVRGAGASENVLFKLDGATGRVLWGPALLEGLYVRTPLLDSSGDVVLLAWRIADGRTVLSKVDGVRGAVAWGPLSVRGYLLRVDRDGNAIVFGDDRVEKHDGKTGLALWTVVPANYFPTDLVVDRRGDVVVSGGSFDTAVVIKYDGGSGAVLWGPLPRTRNYPTQASLALDASGDVFLASIEGEVGSRVAFLAKRDGVTGRELFGTALFASNDVSLAASVDGWGNVALLAGPSAGVSCFPRCEWLGLVADGATGTPLGSPVRIAGETTESYPRPLLVDRAGDLVVTSRTYGPAGESRHERTSIDGQTGFVKWGPISDVAEALASGFDRDGNVVEARDGAPGTLLLAKRDRSTGAVIWGPNEVSFGGSATPYPSVLVVDSRGDVLVAGSLRRGPFGSDSTAFVLKVDGGTGAVRWGPAVYAGTLHDDYLTQLLLNAKDEPVIVVQSLDFVDDGGNFFAYDVVAMKYDASTGERIWGPTKLRVPGFDSYVSGAAALGPDGSVFVSALSPYDPAADDPIVKYDAATGSVVWGPLRVDHKGAASALAVDARGDLFTLIEGGIAKYSGSTGSPLWGPVIGQGVPSSLDLDADGNVLVVSADSSSGRDEATVSMYDGATGNRLFGPLFERPAGSGKPLALRVAGGGFVMTTSTNTGIRATGFARRFGLLGGALPVASCGTPYQAVLSTANGAYPLRFEATSGTFPLGLALKPTTGEMVGTPRAGGLYEFRVRVTDDTGATSEGDFALDVLENEPPVAIAVEFGACDGRATLSAQGFFSSYLWQPGGETTPTISVSTLHPTTYGVVATELNGCTRRGSVFVESTVNDLAVPAVSAPPAIVVTSTSCE